VVRTVAKPTRSAQKKLQTSAVKSLNKKAATRESALPQAEFAEELPPDVVTLDRRSGKDRRSGEDRRKQNIPVAVERRKLQRRQKVNRRRQIDPTTCERDYTPEEIEFMTALDCYKRASGRMFPTCSEILEVLKSLGYQKVSAPPAPADTPVASPLSAEKTIENPAEPDACQNTPEKPA